MRLRVIPLGSLNRNALVVPPRYRRTANAVRRSEAEQEVDGEGAEGRQAWERNHPKRRVLLRFNITLTTPLNT